MKFKERLWQLFLMIVLGVTLSVCDAGDSDDNFDENLLTAGTAIASGSSSTSVTSGVNYVKFGNFLLISSNSQIPNDGSSFKLEESFNNNIVGSFYSCVRDDGSIYSTGTETITVNDTYKPDICSQGSVNYLLIGKYK